MTQTKIFLDGELLDADPQQIEALSPGVLTGRGVFETMRVYQEKIPFLNDHLERLVLGLKHVKLPVPSRSFLKHKLVETLESNQLKDAQARLTMWFENEQRRISIVCQPYEPYSEEKYRQGFKGMTVTYERQKTDPTRQFKSISYAAFRQARLKAEKKDFDEALLLDPNGWVMEGTRTNIFLIKGDQLTTPSAQTGCLEGITRRHVLSLAASAGLKSTSLLFKFDEFQNAEEAFLTNSLIEIMPLTSVGKIQIGSGSCGPKTRELQSKYQDLMQRSIY